MKVALCYHGIAKGSNFKNGGLPVGFEHEFDLMTKNLIAFNKDCQFDIYLHSWSLDYEREVVQKLNPKDYVFEESKQFKKPTLSTIIKQNIKRLLGKGYEINRINNIYSRWYSFKAVCDLVRKSGENYDFVIVTRFDMCLFKPVEISEIKNDKFYSGDWVNYIEEGRELLEEEYKLAGNREIKKKGHPFDKEGLQDFFFISSYDYLINNFSEIFTELRSLIKKYGPSNHLIAYGKLIEDGMLKNHVRLLSYYKDYFLSRWL